MHWTLPTKNHIQKQPGVRIKLHTTKAISEIAVPLQTP